MNTAPRTSDGTSQDPTGAGDGRDVEAMMEHYVRAALDDMPFGLPPQTD
jgi:hypothetical protein